MISILKITNVNVFMFLNIYEQKQTYKQIILSTKNTMKKIK